MDEAEMLSRELVKADESPRDRALRRGMRLFALLDEALDGTAISTPDTAWLSNPRIAGLVRDAILFWDGDRYHLHRYVVMPNHVHLLFEPLPFRQPSRSREVDEARPWPLGKIMQGLKGYTAREANRIRGRGGTFWQDESYDHWIRDNASYDAVTAYIDLNPVAAGLCQCPEEWPWSSAAGLRTSVEIAE
ncbi:MAG: transposase [Actinomycetota bacterium]